MHSLKEDWKDAMAWSRESVGFAFPLKVWTLSATGSTERVVCGLYDDRTLDNSWEGIVLTLMCSGDFSSVINLRHARRLDKVRIPLHHWKNKFHLSVNKDNIFKLRTFAQSVFTKEIYSFRDQNKIPMMQQMMLTHGCRCTLNFVHHRYVLQLELHKVNPVYYTRLLFFFQKKVL